MSTEKWCLSVRGTRFLLSPLLARRGFHAQGHFMPVRAPGGLALRFTFQPRGKLCLEEHLLAEAQELCLHRFDLNLDVEAGRGLYSRWATPGPPLRRKTGRMGSRHMADKRTWKSASLQG